jgi:hypothetical protein
MVIFFVRTLLMTFENLFYSILYLFQPHGEPATSLTLLRRARKLGDTRECAVHAEEFTSLNPLGKESWKGGVDVGGGGGVFKP